MWSPFRYCNGTRTVERDHSVTEYGPDEDLGNFVFLDFAGSGVVHLCGKIKHVTILSYTKNFIQRWYGSFYTSVVSQTGEEGLQRILEGTLQVVEASKGAPASNKFGVTGK